jgi:hypothetical protein
MALQAGSLRGQTVAGWHVRDGQLLVRTARGEEPLVCDCGRGHFLLTEHLAEHRLLLQCHGCGRTCEVALA